MRHVISPHADAASTHRDRHTAPTIGSAREHANMARLDSGRPRPYSSYPSDLTSAGRGASPPPTGSPPNGRDTLKPTAPLLVRQPSSTRLSFAACPWQSHIRPIRILIPHAGIASHPDVGRERCVYGMRDARPATHRRCSTIRILAQRRLRSPMHRNVRTTLACLRRCHLCRLNEHRNRAPDERFSGFWPPADHGGVAG